MTLPNQCPQGNTQAQTREGKLCIVKGPYRIRGGCWAAVHAMALQGFAAIRIGDDVHVFPADIEEGRA